MAGKKRLLSFLCIFLFAVSVLRADSLFLGAEFLYRPEYRLKADLRVKEARFFLLFSGIPGKEPAAGAGLSWSFGCMGLLKGRGLNREIGNPLGFSVFSSVFREKTDFALNSAYRKEYKHSLWLELVPDFLSIHAAAGPEPALSSIIRPVDVSALECEILLRLTWPGTENEKESWLFDKPPWPGGRLLHFALRILYTYGNFNAHFSAAADFSEYTGNGCFFHFRVMRDGSFLKAGLFAGYCSEEYRDPEADLCGSVYRAGIDLRIFFSGAYIRGDYTVSGKRYFPASIIPVHTVNFRAGGRIEFSSRMNLCLDNRFQIKRSAAEGENSMKNLSMISFEPGSLKLSLQYAWSRAGEESKHTLAPGITFANRFCCLSWRCSFAIRPFEWGMKIEYAFFLRIGVIKLSVDYQQGAAGPLGFCIAWQKRIFLESESEE